MKCKTCAGNGAVIADLNDFGFGRGFREFMSAGCFQQQDDRGTTRHEITCPRCDGAGVVVEADPTPFGPKGECPICGQVECADGCGERPGVGGY